MSARQFGLLADLTFLLVGSTQVWLSLRLPNGVGLSLAEPGPGLFPALVGSLMCAGAVVHGLQSFMADQADAEVRQGSLKPLLALAAAIAAYIVLLPRAGFLPAAFVLVLSALSVYGMPGWTRRLITAALTTGLAQLLFTKGLGVNMPVPAWFA